MLSEKHLKGLARSSPAIVLKQCRSCLHLILVAAFWLMAATVIANGTKNYIRATIPAQNQRACFNSLHWYN